MFRIICIFVIIVLAGLSYLPNIKSPAVSIVMSTYNRENLLPIAIDSMLNQSFKNFEFIIINDGSTDNTKHILEQYAAQDNRIKIINNEQNKGLVHSLNKGLNTARGKYIARMDDDDISLPNRLLYQYEYMENHPRTDVLGTSFYYDASTTQNASISTETPTQLKIKSYIQVPLLHPTAFVRNSFLKQHHIQYEDDFRTAEDARIWYQVSKHNGNFFVLKEPLLIYNTHSKKHKGYYSEQNKSFFRFLSHSVGQLIPIETMEYPPTHHQKCAILYAMLNADNLDKYHLEKNAVRKEYLINCGTPPYKMLPIITDAWKDFFVINTPDSNRICLLKMQRCGFILAHTNTELTIAWEKGIDITYTKANDGIYYE